MRVYIVDGGVQGSHVDFQNGGGRVVNGHTVSAACTRPHCPCHPPPSYTTPLSTPHTTRPPLTTPSPPTPPLILSSSQAREHTECASCQAVNGILPADGSGCNGHGTHVASTVGGLKHGVAKNVTLVPVFSCFGFTCSNGSVLTRILAPVLTPTILTPIPNPMLKPLYL